MKDERKDSQGIEALRDLGKDIVVPDRKDKAPGKGGPVVRTKDDRKDEALRREEPTIRVVNRRKQGVLVIRSKMTAEERVKFENVPGAVVVVKEPKSEKKKKEREKKLPDHIRKAHITINDKNKGNPINVEFEGDWVPSDINLAGKFLILDFQRFVRDRAMRGK